MDAWDFEAARRWKAWAGKDYPGGTTEMTEETEEEAPSGEGLPNELRVGNDAMAITIALNGLRAALTEHTKSMVELVEAAMVVLRDDADERNTRLIRLVTGEIGDLRQSVNEILDPPNDADSYGAQSSREREERS